VNAVYGSRANLSNALGRYHDFLSDPITKDIDIEGAIESVGYHCLKNGAISTGVALLEENARLHPVSAAALFGLGRAYRAAGRETEAVRLFNESLKLKPDYQQPKDALTSRRLKY